MPFSVLITALGVLCFVFIGLLIGVIVCLRRANDDDWQARIDNFCALNRQFAQFMQVMPAKYITYPLRTFVFQEADYYAKQLELLGAVNEAETCIATVRRCTTGDVQQTAVINQRVFAQVQECFAKFSSLAQQAHAADRITEQAWDEIKQEIDKQLIILEFDLLTNEARLRQNAQDLEGALRAYSQALKLCIRVTDDIADDETLRDVVRQKQLIEKTLISSTVATTQPHADVKSHASLIASGDASKSDQKQVR